MILIFSLILSPILGYLFYIKNKNYNLRKEIELYLIFVWTVNFLTMFILSLYTDSKLILNEMFNLDFAVKYNALACFVSIFVVICISFYKTQYEVEVDIVEFRKKKKVSKN